MRGGGEEGEERERKRERHRERGRRAREARSTSAGNNGADDKTGGRVLREGGWMDRAVRTQLRSRGADTGAPHREYPPSDPPV